MPLADSSRAIGAVTGLLSERIEQITSHNVTVGRPEPPSANGGGLNNPRLNLFLYEALFDPHLKNTPLDDGQDAPLWLLLRYPLTPFDSTGQSDTTGAYSILGDGLRALNELAYAPPRASSRRPRRPGSNPERLKVTFTEAAASLLSSLMQGSQERYRFSMAFEVRPVIIAPATPASYALLVGVDYTVRRPRSAPTRAWASRSRPRSGPPSTGSRRPGSSPVTRRCGSRAASSTSKGSRRSSAGCSSRSTGTPPGTTRTIRRPASSTATRSPPAATAGAVPHPGLRPYPLRQPGRRRPPPEIAAVSHVAAQSEIDLQGLRLGGAADDVVVALYRDGATVRSYHDVVDAPGSPPARRAGACASAPPRCRPARTASCCASREPGAREPGAGAAVTAAAAPVTFSPSSCRMTRWPATGCGR